MNTNKETGSASINGSTPGLDRKDYAEFLDLAVHELDSPLRKLSVMIEKLAQKYENGLPEEARQYLGRAQSGLVHMRSTIDSINQLSQIDTEEMVVADCDLNQLMSQVISELKLAHKGKNLQDKIVQLPVLNGDSKQLRCLFREILQNAIRFNSDPENIQVEITCKALLAAEKKELDLPEDKNYFKLAVRDNGIGISKDDLKKIFKPFVRLNGRSAYPGNGIGLAICQKIVDHHHGIIYAEPNQQTGSSILLILPQRLN